MKLSFRYGNQLLLDKKVLWANVFPSPEGQEVVPVDPDNLRTIITVGQMAIGDVLSKYPELFFVGMRQDEDIHYAAPSPFTAEAYAKTTGVTTSMADIDPEFHPYWRAVEGDGRNRALVRIATGAAWLMLARRE